MTRTSSSDPSIPGPSAPGHERAQSVLLVAVILLAALAGGLRVARPSLMEPWDWIWYDSMAPVTPADSDLEPYVVILVDDESLAVLGERWPISRATWARLLEVLAAARAESIALDVWFETPEPAYGLELAERILDDLDALPPEQVGDAVRAIAAVAADEVSALDADQKLAQAVSQAGRVVLGMACVDRPHPAGAAVLPDWLVAGSAAGEELPAVAFRCADLSTTFSELGAVALANAGVNIVLEPDGVMRRYPLYFAYQGRVFPNLASAASAVTGAASGGDSIADILDKDGGAPLVRPFDPARIATLGLIDVLDAGAGADLQRLFGGKRVFVGVSALGTRDAIAVPGFPHVPGVYSHVIAAVNLQGGTLVRARSRALVGSVVLSIVGLFVIFLVARRIRVPGFALLCALACVASLACAAYALDQGVLITLVPWWLGLAGMLTVRLGVRLSAARREREEMNRIRGAFQHYMAPEVIVELMRHRDKLRLGGERQTITAFFADIADFTRIAEHTEPARLVMLLNEILSAVTEAVLAQGGIVDKYVGDSTVAMFGAPIAQPDHALRACRAALECQDRVARIRARWREQGLPELHVRIGLDTGVAVVGNIGSETRFDFTMLGDTVNLAARLESVNRVYGTAILVGPETHAQTCDELLFREVDRVRVKGRGEAVSVYEPVGLLHQASEQDRERIARYRAALELFRERSFEAAAVVFKELADKGDGPSREMAARAAGYQLMPPAPDWDGTFVLASK